MAPDHAGTGASRSVARAVGLITRMLDGSALIGLAAGLQASRLPSRQTFLRITSDAF